MLVPREAMTLVSAFPGTHLGLSSKRRRAYVRCTVPAVRKIPASNAQRSIAAGCLTKSGLDRHSSVLAAVARVPELRLDHAEEGAIRPDGVDQYIPFSTTRWSTPMFFDSRPSSK